MGHSQIVAKAGVTVGGWSTARVWRFMMATKVRFCMCRFTLISIADNPAVGYERCILSYRSQPVNVRSAWIARRCRYLFHNTEMALNRVT